MVPLGPLWTVAITASLGLLTATRTEIVEGLGPQGPNNAWMSLVASKSGVFHLPLYPSQSHLCHFFSIFFWEGGCIWVNNSNHSPLSHGPFFSFSFFLSNTWMSELVSSFFNFVLYYLVSHLLQSMPLYVHLVGFWLWGACGSLSKLWPTFVCFLSRGSPFCDESWHLDLMIGFLWGPPFQSLQGKGKYY